MKPGTPVQYNSWSLFCSNFGVVKSPLDIILARYNEDEEEEVFPQRKVSTTFIIPFFFRKMLKTIWIELFSSRQFRHQRVNLWAYYNAIILRRWGSLVRPLHAFVNGGVDYPQSAVQICIAWSGLIEHSMDLTGSKYYATLPCTMSPVQGFVKRGRCTRSIEM